ncbi:MAG TPA: hypothetical protein PKH92_04990 [Anaerolineaceae bacterium]|nr:hypothetical protein [Anaerolineaceae bacterium]
MTHTKTEVFNFRVEPELIHTLKNRALRAGISKAAYLRYLIENDNEDHSPSSKSVERNKDKAKSNF